MSVEYARRVVVNPSDIQLEPVEKEILKNIGFILDPLDPEHSGSFICGEDPTSLWLSDLSGPAGDLMDELFTPSWDETIEPITILEQILFRVLKRTAEKDLPFIKIAWSLTSSSPVPDGAAGRASFITREGVEDFDTDLWLSRKSDEYYYNLC